MQPSLSEEFFFAIECLCNHYDQSFPAEKFIGIGLLCGDDVSSFGPFLLTESAIPEDAGPDYRFNPVDWDNNDGGHCFLRLNALLKTIQVAQADPAFPGYVRVVFDSCAEAVSRLGLRERYGEDLFMTMGGADPTDLLEKEERRFVERTNSASLFAAWLRDFA